MSLKILLADDSLTAQNMGKKILNEAGYEVIAVSNGAQAMKRIVADRPDLVVLDVYMPGYSGLELCERMRNSRETAATPVVLSVGKMEAFRPEEGNRVRADGLIIKPFEATELVAVVKKLTENVPSAPQPKRSSEPEITSTAAEPEPEMAEPEIEVRHQSFEIPQEIAAAPVAGMELIPDADEPVLDQEPLLAVGASTPIEFEVEHEPVPEEPEIAPSMSSIDGFNGVFEMHPPAPAAAPAWAEAAPVEGLETFSAPNPPAVDSQPASDETLPTTVAHDFTFMASEVSSESQFAAVPAVERFPSPSDVGLPPAPEFDLGSFDHGRAEPGIEPVEPGPLPELTSWDDPVTAPGAQLPHVSSDPQPESSAAEPGALEFAPPEQVWVAEEAEIEPHEFAVSLHQQVQQQSMAPERLSLETAGDPSESAEEPLAEIEPHEFAVSLHQEVQQQSMAPERLSLETAGDPSGSAEEPLQAWEIRAPFQAEAEPLQTELASSNPDLAQATPEPEPAPQAENYIAEPEFMAEPTPPRVIEVPVDPERIAHIVHEMLERLKPELIAAVTRELLGDRD